MPNLIFLAVVAVAVAIGAHIIARPDYHARSATGALGNPIVVRRVGIAFVVLSLLAFALTFLAS